MKPCLMFELCRNESEYKYETKRGTVHLCRECYETATKTKITDPVGDIINGGRKLVKHINHKLSKTVDTVVDETADTILDLEL